MSQYRGVKANHISAIGLKQASAAPVLPVQRLDKPQAPSTQKIPSLPTADECRRCKVAMAKAKETTGASLNHAKAWRLHQKTSLFSPR